MGMTPEMLDLIDAARGSKRRPIGFHGVTVVEEAHHHDDDVVMTYAVGLDGYEAIQMMSPEGITTLSELVRFAATNRREGKAIADYLANAGESLRG